MKKLFLIVLLTPYLAQAKFGIETIELKHLNCRASLQYLTVVAEDSEDWQMAIAKQQAQITFESQNEFYNFKTYSDDYCSEEQRIGAEASTQIVKQLQVSVKGETYYSVLSATHTYDGGAHGHYARNAVVYNITKKKMVSHLFTFNPDYPSMKVYEIIEKKLKEKNQYLADFFNSYKKYNPSLTKFYISKKGIVFFFDPYEIGPYSMGEVDVLVTYEELESISIAGERDI